MIPKVVLVEGLPGSGKSTVARLFYELLNERSIPAELFPEGDLHNPADYEGTAYVRQAHFERLRRNYADKAPVLERISERHQGGYLIRYRQAAQDRLLSIEEDLFLELSRNDVYELPLALHEELINKRWEHMAEQAQDRVIVLECCLIQNPVTVRMIKHDRPGPDVRHYIRTLEGILRPLDPLLLYVRQTDIERSFGKAVKERSADWFEGFTHYYTAQGYGLHRGLTGMDGLLAILRARASLEESIVDSLGMKKRVLDNSAFDLEGMKEALRRIIRGLWPEHGAGRINS